MKTYLKDHKHRLIAELIEFLKIPSVSADPKYRDHVFKAADFVADSLKAAGCKHVEICQTSGYPIVYGEHIIDSSLPTILVYGHYDVQPPDPLDLWHSPPFEPVIKDDKIYARGACDDKGQVYMHVKAFEAMIKKAKLPCNVKFMIEGEEEVGSSNLAEFVVSNREKLSANVILISDTSMLSNDVPSVDVGLRGLSYLEVEVIGPNRDLHSGVYGGAVANPINILCEMIASLKNSDRVITIPGFYDDVDDLPLGEREMLAGAPFDLTAYKADLGIVAVDGEAHYTTPERASIRPTLDVNGIWGGYIGEGAKTVLPSKASAKISMRLVPNQSSEKITQLFVDHFNKIAPKSVKVKVTPHHGGEPVVTPTDSIPFNAAALAMKQAFGKVPIPTRGGGSIPIVALFEKELGLKSVLLGFGLDTDAIHSPNEHYGLFNYFIGIETITYFYEHYTHLMTSK